MPDPLSSTAQDAGIGTMLGGPGIGTAIGGGLGLINYMAFQRPDYQRKLALAAATQRYSPWTGLTANAPNSPNPLGSVLSMGTAGAVLGRNLDSAKSDQSLHNAFIDNLNANTSAMQMGAMNNALGGYGQMPQQLPQKSPYSLGANTSFTPWYPGY